MSLPGFSYIDTYTYKEILFTSGSSFVIAIRRNNGRKRVVYVFDTKELPKALDVFHKLPIDSEFMKYFYVTQDPIKNPFFCDIYSLRGHAKPGSISEAAKLKPIKHIKIKDRVRCDIKITSLPRRVITELEEMDWRDYGISAYGGKTRLSQMLLAYFCSLDKTSKKLLVSRAQKACEVLNDDLDLSDVVVSKESELL